MKRPPDCTQTVLVVEDEAIVTLHVRQLLEEAGFRTVAARDADAALEWLANGEEIDVLLTDVTMPGSMDGVRLAKQVSEQWPAVRVAVISGQAVPIGLPAGARFFRKPLDPRDVVAELHMLVDK
ncbi:MAG TPA: response regulator [Xanthobacteraceae bacterium]|nr:response regulator [Xanthobacteraceae bacterium]